MHSEKLARDVVREMDRMPIKQQRRVVEFAHALAHSHPQGTPGRDLVRFSGFVDPADLDEMSEVIEEGCEKVDPDAW
jgi:hypothetical protein